MVSQKTKESVYRAAYLMSCNRILLERGVIDEETYRKMLVQIKSKYNVSYTQS